MSDIVSSIFFTFPTFFEFHLSLSLSLFKLSFTNPVRERIYLCVSRSIRSASSDVRKIFYSIENGILIHARALLLELFPSKLEGGSFIFQRDVLPSCYSTLLRSFASWTQGTKKRAAAYGWIDGWTWMVRSVRNSRINTETWSLELIPGPSKVHLETPAASPPSSKSNLSYTLFRASFFDHHKFLLLVLKFNSNRSSRLRFVDIFQSRQILSSSH